MLIYEMAFVNFLTRFVSEDLHEEANEAMTELFAAEREREQELAYQRWEEEEEAEEAERVRLREEAEEAERVRLREEWLSGREFPQLVMQVVDDLGGRWHWTAFYEKILNYTNGQLIINGKLYTPGGFEGYIRTHVYQLSSDSCQHYYTGNYLNHEGHFENLFSNPILRQKNVDNQWLKPKKKEGVEKAERPICSALTATGNQCKNKACENEELCHVHLKKKNEPPKEKKPKEKKPDSEWFLGPGGPRPSNDILRAGEIARPNKGMRGRRNERAPLRTPPLRVRT